MALFVDKLFPFNTKRTHPRASWLEHRKVERSKKRSRLQPVLFLVPHFFTLANSFCGFYAMILVAQKNLELAAIMILAGACLDSLDGRIARYVGTDGPFGLQLDSLGDAISFCVAPIFLCYFWQLYQLGFWGILLCALFLSAGLLRLARFNVVTDKKVPYFFGVPTTIAAGFLISLFLNRSYVEHYPWFLSALSIIVLLLSLLMVSSIKFPGFKKMPTKKRFFLFIMIVGCAYSIAQIELLKVLLVLFIMYFFGAFFI